VVYIPRLVHPNCLTPSIANTFSDQLVLDQIPTPANLNCLSTVDTNTSPSALPHSLQCKQPGTLYQSSSTQSRGKDAGSSSSTQRGRSSRRSLGTLPITETQTPMGTNARCIYLQPTHCWCTPRQQTHTHGPDVARQVPLFPRASTEALEHCDSAIIVFGPGDNTIVQQHLQVCQHPAYAITLALLGCRSRRRPKGWWQERTPWYP